MADKIHDDLRPARWEATVLVCKDCRRRKNGPHDVKTKAIVHELKVGLSKAERRTRIVRTGCLGVCPKHAVTLALLGAGRPMTAVVESTGQARAMGPTLALWLAGGDAS
jgi:predicted metal-binding protein